MYRVYYSRAQYLIF